MTWRLLIGIVLTSAVAAGCEPATPVPTPPTRADPAPSATGQRAGRLALVGRWDPIPTAAPTARTWGTRPFLEFATDGTWEGSDGCNGYSGRWSIDAAGDFASTQLPSTLLGCEPIEVGGWVRETRTVEVTGELLVLRGERQVPLGTLRRVARPEKS